MGSCLPNPGKNSKKRQTTMSSSRIETSHHIIDVKHEYDSPATQETNKDQNKLSSKNTPPEFCEEHKQSKISHHCKDCERFRCKNCLKQEEKRKHSVVSLGEIIESLIQHSTLEMCSVVGSLQSISQEKEHIQHLKIQFMAHFEEAINQLEHFEAKFQSSKQKVDDSLRTIIKLKGKLQLREALMAREKLSIFRNKIRELLGKFQEDLKEIRGNHIKLLNSALSEVREKREDEGRLFYPKRDVLYIYDIRENMTESYSFNQKLRQNMSCCQINHRLFVIGGYEGINCSKETYELDCNNHKFIRKADMLQGKYGHSVIALNPFLLYSLGGYNSGSTNKCEKYNINLNTWEHAPQLRKARYDLGACSLNQSLIFVFGGYDGRAPLDLIERLDLGMEERGWQIIDLNITGKWTPREAPGSLQIDNENIMLYGGSTRNGYSNQVFTLNTTNNQLIEMAYTLNRGDGFYRTNPYIFEGLLYAFGNFDDLHIFSLEQEHWKKMEKDLWRPKE